MADNINDLNVAREHSLYRSLYMNSKEAIMFLEPSTSRFTEANPATLEMFRCKDEMEFTSREPWKLSPEKQPDGRFSFDKAKEMIDIAMRDGAHFFEWTHKRMDGEVFPATVLLTKVKFDGSTIIQGTVRDISVQKNAERRLVELKKTYQDIIENSSDQIFMLDENGRISFANGTFADLLGMPAAEIVGKQVSDLFTPENAAQFTKNYTEVFKTGKTVRVEEEMDFRGHLMKVSTCLNPVKDENGNVISVVGFARDITA